MRDEISEYRNLIEVAAVHGIPVSKDVLHETLDRITIHDFLVDSEGGRSSPPRSRVWQRDPRVLFLSVN